MPRRRPSPEPEPERARPRSARAGDARAGRAASETADALSGTNVRAGFGWTPREMLVPYVLLALSMQRAHGYLIEESLKRLGFFGIEMSTLYRTLRQLEKEGLLMSDWESGPSGPARRTYTLTDAGRAWLDTWAGALESYRAMIDRFFGLYGGASATEREREEKENRKR